MVHVQSCHKFTIVGRHIFRVPTLSPPRINNNQINGLSPSDRLIDRYPILWLHLYRFLFNLLFFASFCVERVCLFVFSTTSRRVMGNIISLCGKKSETDGEHSGQSRNMANDAVYETTPFEGQKPGTSGMPPHQKACLIRRIEKESQGVYAEELHRELCSS